MRVSEQSCGMRNAKCGVRIEERKGRFLHYALPIPQSTLVLAGAFLWLCMSADGATVRKYDVVVYGGTAGGVITAVAAAREGATVALLEPESHLGGMTSGGLGWTDYGPDRGAIIGGYSREFFERVSRHYGRDVVRKFNESIGRPYLGDTGWYFEPHVAEKVFIEMVKEANVRLFYNHRLREMKGVRRTGATVTEIIMENGDTFQGKIFADCTYEGDLMKQAGVSYTYGREGVAQYNESLAGVREHTPKHQFTVRVSPYDATGKLLPEIQPGPKGTVGAADKKVQAYNFRICMTDVPENRVPFPRPANYNPKRYELLARMLKAMAEKNGRAPQMKEVMKPDPVQGRKTDTNNNGAFSTDYIGGNWDYPEASYKRRAQIWQEHKDYIAGFLYFLANDPQVPKELQQEVSRFGLAKDEFVDTDNWPRQLYVREARRLIGEYVMVQKDIQTARTKPDVIGMGSYNSDSHNIQRLATADSAVENEGDMQVPVQPYQIPYRMLLPKRAEAINLLVPVCFSASHVAYSTLRMEPQYMIIGHAAGVAAKMAIDKRSPVQDVDAQALTAKLRAQRAVMEWTPPAASSAK